MGLRKTISREAHAGERRDTETATRSLEELIEQLDSQDPALRSWAARDLRLHKDGSEIALQRLNQETDRGVIDDLLGTIQHRADADLLGDLSQLLRAENPQLRVGAMEVLAARPELTATWIESLLDDADSDVRIFAIEILGSFAHPKTLDWLSQVLKRESHPNALIAALNALAEVGTPAQLDLIDGLLAQHPDNGMLTFALKLAKQRIEGCL